MHTNSTSPSFVVTIDDSDDPGDVIDALALVDFVAGRQPAARSKRLQRLKPDAPLLPADVVAGHTAVSGGMRSHLATGDGWTLRARRWPDNTGYVTVTAVTDALAGEILAAAIVDAELPPPEGDDRATIGFWHLGGHGPRRVERSIDVDPWTAIKKNYNATAADALERVMALEPPALSGRMLLLHGPPGTGKTTALRALAHAWRTWCQVDCVLDPDRLLRDPGYLMGVALDNDDDDDARRWRLLVLEDCDELIRANAKEGAGQALSRLLNLTDGLVGQGLCVLVCITTNEPLDRLHPAVVRPGRCVAQVEVGRLSRREAAAWLGSSRGIGPDGATLAELLSLRGDIAPIEPARANERPGHYL